MQGITALDLHSPQLNITGSHGTSKVT